MGLQDSVSWYQKKLGTYDKQQWEKTVEQRILHGLTHVMKKTAKLKTDLIDVDLVRGSSFPKAKPKHGIITVTKLALIRWLLLPFYSYWWIEQTCFTTFSLLLLLYVLQLCNMVIYFFRYEDRLFEHISTYEVLVPAGMMLVLSIIHSQIISTNNCSHNFSKSRSKRRRTKRRNFIFDSKQEVYSSKESVSSTPSLSKTKSNVACGTVDSSTSRRKNIGWRVPLQSVTELKDCELIDESEEMYKNNHVKNVQTTAIEDDGFESFNSNGSSENGDDIQDVSRIGQIFCTEELVGSVIKCSKSLKNEKLLKGSSDEKKKKRSAEQKKSNSNSEYNGNEMYNNFKDSNFEESSFEKKDVDCDFHIQKNESPCPNLSRRHLECELHLNCELCDNETDHKDTDSDVSNAKVRAKKSTSPQRLLLRRRGSLSLQAKTTHSAFYNSSCESDENDRFDEPILNECTTSSVEWIGITTNSEDCSVTSEIEESDSPSESKVLDDHPFAWEFQLSPSILNPSCASSDKVSCTIWENNDVKRADLSVLDISSAIIARVETMRETMDYFYVGMLVSCIIAFLPSLRRFIEITQENSISSNDVSFHQMDPLLSLTSTDLSDGFLIKIRGNLIILLETAFGSNFLERFVILTALFERLMLSILFFFLVAVAERTFKQRFLYAKFFSRLTSFRRARKSELPHFRLNKVRNIKTWLSVRSYLKKRGPQRSVDVIVSTAFIVTLLLLSFLSVELLKDSMRLQSEKNLEAVVWCLVLGGYLLRFMTLGNKTNRKYRNLSVLLTEQINLYLQIEQKPHKKDELMVANSVLKLAADLLKELECPFKISGLSANPYVYTITKVVILSALSGVLSELLGFKLKLHKIKIK